MSIKGYYKKHNWPVFKTVSVKKKQEKSKGKACVYVYVYIYIYNIYILQDHI